VGDSACRGAVLRIEQVELSAQCSNCGEEFVIGQFQFICPSCGSMRINVTRGDEFRLLDVTISDDDVLLANENGGLAAPCGNLGGDR
jgi:Zn finger protein HypA/HybF involved in hydrogenase expression